MCREVEEPLASLAVSQAAVTGDFNGDGFDEFIQAYHPQSKTGNFNVGVTDLAITPGSNADLMTWKSTQDLKSVALASGDLDREVHASSNRKYQDEIVVAGVNPSNNQLIVRVLKANSDGELAPEGDSASWQSFFTPVRTFAMACGDVNGDGRENIVLAFPFSSSLRVIVLAWKLDSSEGTSRQLEAINHGEFDDFHTSEIENLDLALGDIDGDHRDEIMIAWGSEHFDNEKDLNRVQIEVFDVLQEREANPTTTEPHLIRIRPKFSDEIDHGRKFSRNIQIAAGDTDCDGYEEIVIGYYTITNSIAYMVKTYNGNAGHSRFRGSIPVAVPRIISKPE